MKKKAIVLLAFAAALTAISCQSDEELPQQPTNKPMVINAVAEGIGTGTRATMAYKYDVIWKMGDEICVRNSQKSVRFTLVGGAGTTKGTFSSTEGDISGEVEGFYPASVENLIWPAEQQNNQVPPMYCKKTLSSTQNQTFNFASLGSVLQLTFSTTSSDIVLKSIEVKADEAMSGAFTIENGQAKVSQPEGDKPGITLDLGDEGVKVGVTAKKFNIAVPAGEYNNLTITFIAKDGKKCAIHATKPQSIEYNTVNTLAISGEFKADLPAGALPGVFTVSGTKKIRFSQGNLYYDGANWGFEAEQYYFRTYCDGTNNGGKCDKDGYNPESGTAKGHWGLFGWSTEGNNYGMSTSRYDSGYSGNFVDWGKAYCTSKGIAEGTWATLSGGGTGEWKYLFEHHVHVWGTCNKVPGHFIAPDGFEGDADALSKAIEDWKIAQAAGIVFLPAAGNRSMGSDDESPVIYVENVGDFGNYWSSSVLGGNRAFYEYFNVIVDYYNDYRSSGFSVRLVTEIK